MITPLPKLPCLCIALLQVSECVAFASILPWVQDAIYKFGIAHDKASIGYYAGFIEATMFLTEAMCVLQWARLSDKLGRRPILVRIVPLRLRCSGKRLHRFSGPSAAASASSALASPERSLQ
jgi:MFS family permease